MQSNPPFGTTICYNGNQAFNILQQQQQQQNILNTAQINLLQPDLSQKQTDTTFTKIFVGGLPYHTTDESLKNFFQKFGNIEEAVVINDRQTGKSRGYGFVTMETKEAAEAAIFDPNPIIDGRKANVNLAYLGVKSRTLTPSIIPLTIRYQLPATSTQAAYGFHPSFYYHPSANTSVQQQAFTNTFLASTPNLLISAQNPQVPTNTLSPNKNALLTSAYDLTSAYSTNGINHAALNTNRSSPFEPSAHLTTTSNPFFPTFNSSNSGAINSILNPSAQTNANYFAMQQNFSNPFQTQLNDRL